jgi:hypothetical protein
MAVMSRVGCTTAAPTPQPTPSSSPTYPRVIPNSSLLENLNTVRALEDASGRRSVLMRLAGPAEQDSGRIASGSHWGYVFADHDALTSQETRIRIWAVWSDGRVTFEESLNVGQTAVAEIGPALQFDSPQVVRMAREYGAQPYLDRYPSAIAGTGAEYLGGRVVWQVVFFGAGVGRPPCELGPIYIDARTGELLHADLGCLKLLN